MVERYTVTDQQPVVFEGLFKPDELFQVIRRFLGERGYFIVEQKNFEEVYEHGVQVTIELMPFRQLSEYLKKEMKINILIQRGQERIVEIDGAKQKFMHGKISMKFSAWLTTDLKAKWEGTGWMYFLRTLNDKFIRRDWITRAKIEVEADCSGLIEEVRSYLNMIRFKDDILHPKD